MQVIELAKQTRGNTVSGTLVMNNGTLATLAGKRNVPAVTAAMLQRGTANLSRKEIADRLEDLKATINLQGTFDALNVTFQTRRDKLPEVLELIAEMMRRPTFPEAELEQFKSQTITAIDLQRHEPQAVAQNALIRYDNPYPKGDIRYAPTFDEAEDITKAMTVATLKAFHDDFYGADHAQLALVGDFDPAIVEPLLGKLFGDWKAKIAYVRVPQPYRLSPLTAQQFETPDKANAFYMAKLAIPVKADDADFVPLILANRVLGGGGLKSRIVDRLRGQDGISYGAGSGLSEANYEANSALNFAAIYAPQNLTKLKTDMAEVLAAFLKDGVTEQELAEAKSGLLQQWAINRTQDNSLASDLALNLRLGRTMAFTETREAKIKSTTVEQVNGVIRKYLKLDQLVQMYAGDFAKARILPANSPGYAPVTPFCCARSKSASSVPTSVPARHGAGLSGSPTSGSPIRHILPGYRGPWDNRRPRWRSSPCGRRCARFPYPRFPGHGCRPQSRARPHRGVEPLIFRDFAIVIDQVQRETQAAAHFDALRIQGLLYKTPLQFESNHGFLSAASPHRLRGGGGGLSPGDIVDDVKIFRRIPPGHKAAVRAILRICRPWSSARSSASPARTSRPATGCMNTISASTRRPRLPFEWMPRDPTTGDAASHLPGLSPRQR